MELCRPDAVPRHRAAAAAAAAAASSAASAASVADADGGDKKDSASKPEDSDSTEGPGAKKSIVELAPVVGTGTEASDQLSFFPDPTRDVAEHSPVARGVAYIFLKRQQVQLMPSLLGSLSLMRVIHCRSLSCIFV